MTTDVRGMGQIAAKYWWVILVRGIILILLGMAMLIWPKQSLQVFGIIVLFNPAAGILSILWLVAIWAIMAGIIFAIASFFVRKAGNIVLRETSAS
jgi:uncharacterized membrane protein HdeD (DUF308 family)